MCFWSASPLSAPPFSIWELTLTCSSLRRLLICGRKRNGRIIDSPGAVLWSALQRVRASWSAVGECTLVREGRGESALTGCAVLITSRLLAGSVLGRLSFQNRKITALLNRESPRTRSYHAPESF